MIRYFLLANIYACLLFCIYILCLKDRSSHSWSRFYLLGTVLLPLILPFLRFDLPFLHAGKEVISALQLPEVVVGTAARSDAYIPLGLFTGYVVIAFLLLGRLVSRFIRLQFFLRDQTFIRHDRYRIALNTKAGPGSFGRTILFPGLEADPAILRHEMAHLSCGHHYDQLLLRLIQCFFFPVILIHLIHKELETVHEFEADAVAALNPETYSSLLLNQHFETNQFPLLQSFFHHPLKRRILMLHQSDKKGMHKLLLAATTLAICGILTFQSASGLQAQEITNSTKEAPQDKVFTSVEQMPKPPFEMQQYLADHIKYPEAAKKAGIQGRVVAQFVVNQTGKIEKIKILRGIHPDCDKEVIRVLQGMPAWKPGEIGGEKVKVYYTLPVSFRLGSVSDPKIAK